jgi:diguanylate cyclase (GGDEF)-like protein
LGITAVILLVDYLRPSNYAQNQMIHILASFCCYTVIAFPLRLQVIPVLIITVWDVFMLFFVKTDISRPVLNVTLATITIMNVMGLVVSMRLATFRRRQYQALTKEAKLIQELEIMATTDNLTDLLSRRRLFELAEKEFQRFKRYGSCAAILMLDMDYFKAINDQYGHPVGDAVLIQFSRIISQTIRQSDFAGRIGGEEFAILLPQTSKSEALILAERIRLSCAAIAIETDTGRPKVTVSIGVTETDPGDEQFEDIIHRMDRALYHAKKDGRNCCRVA